MSTYSKFAVFLCLLSCLPMINSEDASDWRQLYDQLFWTVFDRDLLRSDVQQARLQLGQVLDVIESLGALIKSQNESIAGGELDDIEYWSNASRFNPGDCRTTKEVEIFNRYSEKLNSTRIMVPNLKVYVKYLMDSLLKYCLSMQDEIIVRHIKRLPQAQMSFVSSLGSKEFPPKLRLDVVARYLAPFFPSPEKKMFGHKFPNLERVTWKLYEEKLGIRCDVLKSLPVDARYAAGYLRHRYVSAIWDINPMVIEWLRANDICNQLHGSLRELARLMPREVKDNRKRLRSQVV